MRIVMYWDFNIIQNKRGIAAVKLVSDSTIFKKVLNSNIEEFFRNIRKVWHFDDLFVNTINIWAFILVFNISDDCYDITIKAY